MSRLIAFWSPSGAGATTLLLNTAAALGARGAGAGGGLAVADLNLTTPTAALAADLLPHDRPFDACASRLLPALEEGRLTGDAVDQMLLDGPGFSLLAGVLDTVAATRMTEEHIKRMIQLLSLRFDWILADLTPALDSVACLPMLEMADRVILVAGPEIGSRFHTRRFVLPMKAMGLDAKFLAVLNRSEAGTAEQVAQDIDLPVRAVVPDLRQQHDCLEAGQIAYLAQGTGSALGRFRTAIDGLAALIAK
ncbi:MAG: Cellulose biosynthesis protein BcsQ [Symbiobacteriaceae bacterium]|jgi:Flp pilus assembly CpaE family ATPase|nr:Cellulose biosynthesis protein BcsQ [Symbiobacteriaceae bacterium]